MAIKQTPGSARLRRLFGEDPERILGMRVRDLREAAGLTQAQLARKMSDAGFPMTQAVYGRIETNSRPVRVNEATVLATLLGVRLPDLLADPDLDAEAGRIRAELQKVTTQRLEAERDRAAWKAQAAEGQAAVTAAHAQLALSAPALRDLEARERELTRQFNLARLRTKGHSPAPEDGDI